MFYLASALVILANLLLIFFKNAFITGFLLTIAAMFFIQGAKNGKRS